MREKIKRQQLLADRIAYIILIIIGFGLLIVITSDLRKISDTTNSFTIVAIWFAIITCIAMVSWNSIKLIETFNKK